MTRFSDTRCRSFPSDTPRHREHAESNTSAPLQAIAIEPERAARLAPLLESAGKALGNARSRARFLCGCTSPALTRARLGKHALFGELCEVPFAQVLAWSEALLTKHDCEVRAQRATAAAEVALDSP